MCVDFSFGDVATGTAEQASVIRPVESQPQHATARPMSDRFHAIISDVAAGARSDDSDAESSESDSDEGQREESNQKAVKERWTKSDSARLIELVRSTEARPLMTHAGDILTRAELDIR